MIDIPRDRRDYQEFLREINMSEEEAIAFSKREVDQIPMYMAPCKVKVGDSAIQGKGLIASTSIGFGEVIGVARIKYLRTPLGRYANHSADPNTVLVKMGKDELSMVAIRRIAEGEEVTVNYRQVGRIK
jgi:hypothetical protein